MTAPLGTRRPKLPLPLVTACVVPEADAAVIEAPETASFLSFSTTPETVRDGPASDCDCERTLLTRSNMVKAKNHARGGNSEATLRWDRSPSPAERELRRVGLDGLAAVKLFFDCYEDCIRDTRSHDVRPTAQPGAAEFPRFSIAGFPDKDC